MRICSYHQDYETPLIWTYAFRGAEYWCPYCGFSGGMLGSGDAIEETEELKKRLEIYEKLSEDYLHAHGTTYCIETMWKGERVKLGDLPEEEKQRLAKIREEGWKLNIKAEDLNKIEREEK